LLIVLSIAADRPEFAPGIAILVLPPTAAENHAYGLTMLRNQHVDVNEYLRDATGEALTARDVRTWVLMD